MYYLTEEDFKKAWKNGITMTTLKARYYQYGWSLEKAINSPLYPNRCKYLEKARQNGIAISTYYTRINKGWSKEKACTIKTNYKKRNQPKEVMNIKEYDKYNKCPYDYNLIYDTSICIKNGKCKDCWLSIKEV